LSLHKPFSSKRVYVIEQRRRGAAVLGPTRAVIETGSHRQTASRQLLPLVLEADITLNV
jgi:hypothetical protein